ncbi:hypothetical protein IAU60_001352 [Kwoniella sp. DSM 27419]
MLPTILLSTLPVPSLLLLLIVIFYHLTPLLTLVPNLTPALQRLSTIIPHPRRARNLPREFFNLPPRPGSPTPTNPELSIRGRLGVRGGFMLILLVEAIISLSCGWAALTSGRTHWGLIAASLVPLPSSLAIIAVYAVSARPAMYDRRATGTSNFVWRRILHGGGITHHTLFPRILPLAVVSSLIGIIPSAIISSPVAGHWLLAHTALSIAVVICSAAVAMWRMTFRPREGTIRLRGESRMSLYEKEGMRPLSPGTDQASHEQDGLPITDDWVSSPSRPPTPLSSFHYTPGYSSGTATTGVDETSIVTGSYSSSSSGSTDSFKTPRSKPSNSSFAATASFDGPGLLAPSQDGSSTVASSTLLTPQSTLLTPLSSQSASPGERSWLSEPTNTPQSIVSAWNFASPETAITRSRSASPSQLPLSTADGQAMGLPQPPIEPRIPDRPSVATTYTMGSTPGSRLHAPDASILAQYSPDPFHPLPRAFESLTSFPMTPSQRESRTSLLTRSAPLRSADALACIPVERVDERGSTIWTLASYHSPAPAKAPDGDAYKTPDHRTGSRGSKDPSVDRRAPPPPPMPVNMPLPPTPTHARSSTLFDLSGGEAGKGSMDLLMGAAGHEADWVAVEKDVDTLQGWGRGGRGVGAVAVMSMLICWALSIPVLVRDRTGTATTLYLVSLLLPSPTLALISVLLRHRPIPVSNYTRQNGSTKSLATNATGHRSLALLSDSQLSLPITVSPKLTPPAPNRASAIDIASPTIAKKLEPKPSLTTFVAATRSPVRRHTIYGGLSLKDLEAEEAMRKTLARRSGDVWIESGHAIEGGNRLSRAAEMLKPVPAMRVLDSQPKVKDPATLRSLRGGVVSMLVKRASRLFESDYNGMALAEAGEADHDQGVTASPARSGIAISIIAPSPERRRSRLTSQSGSSIGDEVEGESEPSWQSQAQIGMAQRGRMSSGPKYIFANGEADQWSSTSHRAHDEGYELDWMTAGVLPGLLPSIRIGSDVRVEPVPRSAPASTYQHDIPSVPAEVIHRPASEVQEMATHARTASRSTLYSQFQDADPSSDEQDYEDANASLSSMPSFHASSLREQSTPQATALQRKQRAVGLTLVRSCSSSIDLTRSPEFYTARTSSSEDRKLRQRAAGATIGIGRSASFESSKTIQHKASFGLPRLDKNALEFSDDLRKSFDELRRPVLGGLQGHAGSSQSAGQGVDLPSIPYTLKHKPSLSRVSEMTEEPTVSMSAALEVSANTPSSASIATFSQSALDEMRLTLALAASPATVNPNATTTTNFSQSALEDMRIARALAATPRSASDRSSVVHMVDELEPGDVSFASSISSHDEAVEEMERVMAMDTPTRAEFVSSPPPSEVGSGRTSRASERSVSTVSTALTYTTASASMEESPRPPVPILPAMYRQPAGALSHPHPPPSMRNTFRSINFSGGIPLGVPTMGPHHPVQSLLPLQSTETLHSAADTSASSMATPPTRIVQARPSQAQLRQAKDLEERNEQPRPRTATGHRPDKPSDLAVRRGAKALSVIADHTGNRITGMRSAGGRVESSRHTGKKRVSILEDEEVNKLPVPLAPMAQRAKRASGSNKENVSLKKGSKASTGSGSSGVRGLRA